MQPGSPQSNGRPGEDAHLRNFSNFLLRNRLLAFGVPALVLLATVVFVQLVTPVYDASVWIRIDEEKSNLPVLDALKDLSSGSQIGTEMQVLQRRPLAEAVIDSLALQLVVARPRRVPRSVLFESIEVERTAPAAEYRLVRREDGRFTVTREDEDAPLGDVGIGEAVRLDGARAVLAPGAAEHDEIRVVVREFARAVKSLRESMAVIRPDREADVVVVRYQASDPELVRAVPNALARLFIAQRLEVKKIEARSTVAFLREQLDTLSLRLFVAEEELKDFREDERIVSLKEEGRTELERLAELQGERDLLDAEREALAEMLAEVRETARADPTDPSPFRRLMAFPSLLRNFAVSELFRSLAEVENERAELLNRRTLEDPDVLVLTRRIRELEEQLKQISTTYLSGLTRNVASLDAKLARFQLQLADVPAKEIRFARLDREAEVLAEIYTLLQTRLQEAQIVAAVEDPSVRVVEPAIRPQDPIKPNKPVALLLALVLGVTVGVGGAFVRENMDTTIRTREELQLAVAGVPVLGLIPRIQEAAAANGKSRRPGRHESPAFESRLVAGRDPRNPVTEAYRSLRTNIAFARPERTPKTLVVTSPTPGDGKSTSSANLAITLAQQGTKCLLVDADMRRGFLNDVFRVGREPGLSNVLLGRAELADAIVPVDLGESGTLDFLPTGTLPPNPAELVGSERMQALLERMAAGYDVVVMDAPPLNLVTDAALLGTYADGVLVVARSGVTDQGAVAYAMEQLGAVRAPVLGAVLNDIDQKKDRYYGTYSTGAHADYYGVQEES